MNNREHLESAQELYQNAPCGFLIMRLDGCILDVNKTLLTWLGFKRNDVVGEKTFQDLLVKGGEIYFETYFIPLLQLQGEVTEINMELKGKGDIQMPVLINANKADKKSGNRSVFRMSLLDISHRKLYEKEIIKERKKAEDAMVRLSEINVELERFVHRASHDLQAPLKTISTIISLIKAKNLIEPDSKVDELFSVIKRNTKQMMLMVEDLFEYSKIDVGSVELEPISLEEVCRESINIIINRFENDHITFNISDLPIVMGVRIQLLNLFLNLFSNAIKYRSDADPVITITSKKENGSHKIFIKDNGIGFEEKYKDKVFEFMERLHGKDTIEGTGIGLSTCKRIVENHGGQIGVESNPGRGSTFYFSLTGV